MKDKIIIEMTPRSYGKIEKMKYKYFLNFLRRKKFNDIINYNKNFTNINFIWLRKETERRKIND